MEEQAEKKFEIDFLTDEGNYYLSAQKDIEYEECEELGPGDWALYHMEEITFEEKAPRKEALENFISAMKIPETNFVYLVMGDENGVHFYYGVAKKLTRKETPELSVHDIGKYILKTGVEGNFRGSQTTEVAGGAKQRILDTLDAMRFQSVLEGVPGYNKEDDQFQGADRLADVMMGDKFAFVIIASPLEYSDIKEIEQNLFTVYDRLAPIAKMSIQEGKSLNTSFSKGSSTGVSKNCSENYGDTYQEGVSINDSLSGSLTKTVGKSYQYTAGDSEGDSEESQNTSSNASNNDSVQRGETDNHTEGTSINGSFNISFGRSEGNTESTNSAYNNGFGTSSSKTIDMVSKASQDWIKYLDEVIMPRLDYGMGKGVFITTSYLLAEKKSVLTKLQNTVISLYSGEKGNKIPLRAFDIKDNNLRSYLMNFQLPIGTYKKKISGNEMVSRAAVSQYANEADKCMIGNWITTNELSVIAGLPRKEVVGLALKEEVEFGLNFSLLSEEEEQKKLTDEEIEKHKLSLGKLVQSGHIIDKEVYLDRRSLDKHVFIAGVTGSGKTTTCQTVLINSRLPFLVIEPAKTEYRLLKREEQYSDLLVFTLGNDSGTPFRLNPFEFFPHESITSRVDMLRASIEAAFDMEAAIPQIIEAALYACYEDYGWNVSTNENKNFENTRDAFKDGVFAFPTLSDLVEKVEVVVNKQGFDDRLKKDYLGSIKARLNGLLVGAKGLMLNTRRSIDFRELLKKNVVLELEEIRNGSEKSLVMGFVLTNLMEAIKAEFNGKSELRHITLVEEAHRLLSKYEPGDSPNKKHGVETFTDMLAEIRKYGESLIIVDQIPNKLTPEVLKNTNTKIVHKIFAADDKEAIGNTIALNDDQKGFLSNLVRGRSILFTQGLDKAVQVHINIVTKKKTTDDSEIKLADLQNTVYDFYCKFYKKGIIPNLQYCASEQEAREWIERMLAYSKEKSLPELIQFYIEKEKALPGDSQVASLKKMLDEKESINAIRELMCTKAKTNEKHFSKIRTALSLWKDNYGMDYLVYFMMRLQYVVNAEKIEPEKVSNPEYITTWKEYIGRFIDGEGLSTNEVINYANKL